MPCLIKDDQLRYCIVNREYARLYGLSPEAMLGQRATGFYPETLSEQFEAREKRVLQTGETIEIEEQIVAADGVRRCVTTRISRIVADEGEVFVCITLDDVTELHRARREALDADSIKSDFLGTISHELRTPLNGVVGLIELLLHEDLTPPQRQLARLIKSSGESLIAVVSDILDFTTIEAGRLRLSPAPFDVERLVEDVAQMMTPVACAMGLPIILSCGPKPPRQGYADATRIKQIITNFVTNAVKFTDEGFIEIRVDGDAGRNELRLSVIDSGIGLSREESDAVFERFERSARHKERPRQGVGLGLSICRALAELMGGRVEVASTEGEGSTFTLTMPLASGGAPPKPTIAAGRSRPPIEINDPFPPRARAWRERLTALGYQVREKGDPGSCIHIVALVPPDLEDSQLARTRERIASAIPAIVTVPLSCSDKIPRLTSVETALAVVYTSCPTTTRDVEAAIETLTPWLDDDYL